MEEIVKKDIAEKIADLQSEIEELEAEKKGNYRKILELTEKELQNRELHTEEIHSLRKKNFEISFQILTKKNEKKKLKYYPPEA